jgi:glycosyltransferase involved in cell wall biosynthesis
MSAKVSAPARDGGEENSAADGRLRVLSLCTVYPNAQDPQSGLFVRSRLQALGELADVTVVAPLAIVEYSSRRVRLFGKKVRTREQDGMCRVLRPKWFYPPMGGIWNSIFLFLRLLGPLARLRKEFPFQVIDAHFGYPEGVAAALLSWWFRVPFAITFRGSETDHSRWRGRKAALEWASRRASRIITVSDRLQKFAIALGAERAQTRHIGNGVNTELFHPVDREAIRRLYRLPAPLIVSAGHLIPLKGHHRIVRALKGLHEEGIRAGLLILGGEGTAHSCRSEILAQIRAAGLENEVHLLGERRSEDVAALIGTADVFCLASSSEGHPNVVNEALACGTPVVATDVGAVPQMLPSEEYGIIVPRDDVPALERGLRRALTKDWDRTRIAAFGKQRTWRQVGEEAFEELAAAAGRRLNDLAAPSTR